MSEHPVLELDLSSHWSLVTLNKLNFSFCSCVLIHLKFGWRPRLCPACSRSDAEEQQMQETTSAGSVWHCYGKLHFPLLVLLSFTLSRCMTSLYIIKPRAHASPSVTILASPRLHYLIGWGCHQSQAAELARHSDQWSDRQVRVWPWAHPFCSNPTPQRVEAEIKLQN